MHTIAALTIVWPFVAFAGIVLWNLAKIHTRSR